MGSTNKPQKWLRYVSPSTTTSHIACSHLSSLHHHALLDRRHWASSLVAHRTERRFRQKPAFKEVEEIVELPKIRYIEEIVEVEVPFSTRSRKSLKSSSALSQPLSPSTSTSHVSSSAMSSRSSSASRSALSRCQSTPTRGRPSRFQSSSIEEVPKYFKVPQELGKGPREA